MQTCSAGRFHSSGAVWELRWPSWAVRPNEPSGFRGRKAIVNRAHALIGLSLSLLCQPTSEDTKHHLKDGRKAVSTSVDSTASWLTTESLTGTVSTSFASIVVERVCGLDPSTLWAAVPTLTCRWPFARQSNLQLLFHSLVAYGYATGQCMLLHQLVAYVYGYATAVLRSLVAYVYGYATYSGCCFTHWSLTVTSAVSASLPAWSEWLYGLDPSTLWPPFTTLTSWCPFPRQSTIQLLLH